METGRKENLTGADTVQSPVTENKNYIAVYRNIPREYTVILEDAYGNVVEIITAAYGKQMPNIMLPAERMDYLQAITCKKMAGEPVIIVRQVNRRENQILFRMRHSMRTG